MKKSVSLQFVTKMHDDDQIKRPPLEEILNKNENSLNKIKNKKTTPFRVSKGFI